MRNRMDTSAFALRAMKEMVDGVGSVVPATPILVTQVRIAKWRYLRDLARPTCGRARNQCVNRAEALTLRLEHPY